MYELLSKSMVTAVTARFEKLKEEIAESISSHGLTASGQTAQSMYVVSTDFEVSLFGRNFFAALETGSSRWAKKTGVPCTFTEFRGIISNWASTKGLNLGQHRAYEKAVSNIAWKIIKTGTKQKRSGNRLDVYTSLVEKAAEDCSELVADCVGVAVDNIITKLWGVK